MSEKKIIELAESFFNLNEVDLFLHLGQALNALNGQERSGVLRHHEDDLESLGRSWFLSKYKEIQRKICSDITIIEFCSNQEKTIDIGLVLLIAQRLLDPLGVPVSILIAILVCRRGVEKFCKGFES